MQRKKKPEIHEVINLWKPHWQEKQYEYGQMLLDKGLRDRDDPYATPFWVKVRVYLRFGFTAILAVILLIGVFVATHRVRRIDNSFNRTIHPELFITETVPASDPMLATPTPNEFNQIIITPTPIPSILRGEGDTPAAQEAR